ncbi:MAG: amidase domain-containing protein [Clostridia bacterium]|nr:amidase domain-containing protein [Clostridia bacterium]
MKKFMLTILSIFTIVSICPVVEVSSVAISSTKEDEIITDVTSVIESFYFNKDVCGKAIDDVYLESNIASFLSDKIETHQYVTDIYDTNKENYEVDVILLNETLHSNILNLEFQVITTYNYVGVDFDTTVSETVFIEYDYSSNKILDFYVPLNYYDSFVRSNETTSLNTADNNGFFINSNIAEKQKNIIDSINDVYASEMATINSSKVNTAYVQPRTSTLNHQAIVDWATANCNKNTPSSGNGTVPYYDFSEITGSYDCTNFVSHALLAGGATVNDTGNSGISSSGWYYRSLSNRSSAWSGVDQFYNYMSTSTASNKATAINNIFQYTYNGAYWGLGSVLQIDYNSNSGYEHSTIITKETKSSDGTRSYAYITSRTSDSSYHKNAAVADEYATGNKRIINVYNY